MSDENKKVSPEVSFEETEENKDLQERIVGILEKLFFGCKIYFHVEMSHDSLDISVKVKDYEQYNWELGDIKFNCLQKLSEMSDSGIKDLINKRVEFFHSKLVGELETRKNKLDEESEFLFQGMIALDPSLDD